MKYGILIYINLFNYIYLFIFIYLLFLFIYWQTIYVSFNEVWTKKNKFQKAVKISLSIPNK